MFKLLFPFGKQTICANHWINVAHLLETLPFPRADKDRSLILWPSFLNQSEFLIFLLAKTEGFVQFTSFEFL